MSWLERLSTGQVASVESRTLGFPLPEAAGTADLATQHCQHAADVRRIGPP